MHHALEAGDLERVRILEKQGADLEQKSFDGETPLFTASRTGQLAVVRYLMEQQASKKKQWRWILFSIICFLPYFCVSVIAILWMLLSLIFPKFTSMFNNLTCVEVLVEHIRTIVENSSTVLERTDVHDETPLVIASRNGHLAVVRYLVEQGAYINITDSDGTTPLIWASIHGHVGVVRYLSEKGAYKNKVTYFYGRTAMHHAAQGFLEITEGQLEVVRYFVEQGADMEKADRFGNTPLLIASWIGHLDVVRYLLEQGANRDKADNEGRTPLHYAAQNGGLATTKLLMAYGADLNARSNNGQLPIDVTRNEEIRQAIRDEPRRRMDHGLKRATEQDRHSNAAPSASAQLEGTEAEDGKVAEKDEDS